MSEGFSVLDVLLTASSCPTDMAGVAASGSKTSVDGVEAAVVYARREGYDIGYAVADTATNPTIALCAAQKLVTRDHVSAVIAQSALTFAASSYLTARGIPVIGSGSDGPEWSTAKNMFSVVGAFHTTTVATTLGTFLKAHGVTTVGSLGYGIPVSSEQTKAPPCRPGPPASGSGTSTPTSRSAPPTSARRRWR
jgi:branched-chain amino acid transport system substrate-binding protein